MSIMKLIDTQKVKNLLQSHNKKNKELAEYLGIPASGVSDALNGKRPLSMNYVFELGSFFKIEPESLTYENCTKQPAQHATAKGA